MKIKSCFRRIVVIIFSIFLFVLLSASSTAFSVDTNKKHKDQIVTRLDHIVVFADSKEIVDSLMSLFSKEFNLPVFWGPEDFSVLVGRDTEPKRFYSAGVFLGNVTLEFETWQENRLFVRPKVECGFVGAAFEPVELTQAIVNLERKAIEFDSPLPFYLPLPEHQKKKLWTLVDLPHFNNPGLKLFLCQYEPMMVQIEGKQTLVSHVDMRAGLHQQLRANNGGPLMVKRMKELTIGVRDIKKRAEQYSMLIGKSSVGENAWKLSDSQVLRIVPAETDSVVSLTLEVASLIEATEFLKSKSMVGNLTKNTVQIAPEAVHGLKIILTETDD